MEPIRTVDKLIFKKIWSYAFCCHGALVGLHQFDLDRGWVPEGSLLALCTVGVTIYHTFSWVYHCITTLACLYNRLLLVDTSNHETWTTLSAQLE